ncbi:MULTISPECIES: helix-turn-helix transcriptional regulator [unclassified Microbacterium]|uniref:helix-turn-helix transcriptional regulator n=1 Tax=Microbacterium TaxID=33882 RepID=UPI003BA2C2B2
MTNIADEVEIAQALADAIGTGDLDAVEDLADALWFRLPTTQAPALVRLVSTLSPAELERRPRLLLAAYQAHDISTPGGDHARRGFLPLYLSRGERFALRFSAFRERADVHAAGMIALIGARLRGRCTEAEGIAHRLAQQLARMPEAEPLPWSRHPDHRPGWLAAQRALTTMLLGRYDDAMVHARAAFEEMGPAPSHHFAGVNGAAIAALLSAAAGGRASAERWLREVRDHTRGGLPVESPVTAPARLAAAVLAMDQLDEKRARASLRSLGDPFASNELWPFAAAGWARFGALFGSPIAALLQLDEVCAAHGAGSRIAEIAGGLLLRVRADLLLAAGDGAAVLGIAVDHPDQDLLNVPLARAHLRAGHLSEAVRLSSSPLQRATTTRRDALDHLLVLAAAQLRRGDEHDARELFRRAHEYYLATHNRSAFREMDPDDLARLCTLAGVHNPLPEGTGTAHAPLRVVRLTPREQIVLRALATSETLGMIAQRLNVSLNTVRSQARSVYRKLGVSSREDAVAVAARARLL